MRPSEGSGQCMLPDSCIMCSVMEDGVVASAAGRRENTHVRGRMPLPIDVQTREHAHPRKYACAQTFVRAVATHSGLKSHMFSCVRTRAIFPDVARSLLRPGSLPAPACMHVLARANLSHTDVPTIVHRGE